MYTQKDFSNLLGLGGFSDTMLSNHFTLYKGYVDNSNKMIAELDKVEKGSMEYYELKRRLGWEVNGVKLHELYFENLVKGNTGEVATDIASAPNIKLALESSYGSLSGWEESLRRNGTIRGIGWVLLIKDHDTGAIMHTWVAEHNANIILNADILMVMDMWEHAYMTDYGIKKADYINTFIKSINWKVVESRLN